MSDNVFSLPPPGGFIEVKGQEVQVKDKDGKIKFWFMAEDEAMNIAFALQNMMLDTYGEAILYMERCQEENEKLENGPRVCVVCGKVWAVFGYDKCKIHLGSLPYGSV